MLNTIPFEIPAHFLAKYQMGDLVRFGTILKEVGTGKIVGHVQETGLAQSIMSSVISGAPTPISLVSDVVNSGTGIYTAIQVAGLKSMVTQIQSMLSVLQTLQIATLGVSMVGIGVSIAGFLYTRKRFDALDDKIDLLIRKIDAGFENQRKSQLRAHISVTKSLIQRASYAQALSSPQSEFNNISSALSDQAGFFEGEISVEISKRELIELELFWQLVQAFLLCNSVRIDCQIRNNELKHALRISESVADSYGNLFNQVTPTSFTCGTDDGLSTVQVLRDATDSAAAKPYLIDYLRTIKIDGGSYMDAVEREKEHPIFMLKTGSPN